MGVVRTLPLFFALALSAACGSSSETSTAPSQLRCAVDARADVASFTQDGGSGVVRVATARECSWTARSEVPWVTLATAGGQGDGDITFRVAANGDPVSRLGAIAVSSQQVQVSQDARPCSYQIPAALDALGAAGGERTVPIAASSAQCRWTAVSDVPWIAIASAREGSGTGTVRVTVEPLAGPPRVGSVTIAGQVVTIAQSTTASPSPRPGCGVTVEPAGYAVAATGGVTTLAVRAAADCAWTASSPVDWIAVIAGITGTGPGDVRVTVYANAGPARDAALTIGGQAVTVTQASGCSLTINPASVTVGAEAGTGAVQIATAAGCAWSAASTAGWMAITAGASGSGSGQVRFSVAANTGPARGASLAIGDRTVAVSQANGCTYAIAPPVQDVAGAGASGTVVVTTAAGCPWTASSDAGWIAMMPGAATGPGQLSFTVAPNPGPARTAIAAVAGQPFTVRQASPCSWSFAPPSHLFDASGGNGAILVHVTGPCTWNAISNVGWATVTTGSTGTGSGLVQFVVAPNTGPARTGTLTIGGERYEIVQTSR